MMLNALSISCERKQLCNFIMRDLAIFSAIKLAQEEYKQVANNQTLNK